MNKKTRKLSICLGLLLCALLAACTSNTASPTATAAPDTAAPTAAAATATPVPQPEGPQPLFAETFAFSILQGIHPPATETNRVQDLVEERTNTKITRTMVPSSGFADKASVTLASGILPDMVYFMWQSVVPAEWIDQGAVIPLDELLDEYGPNITKVYYQDDILPYVRQSDGHIYSVNNYCSFTYNTSVMIRRDWLSDLGLHAPSTMEEWISVLTAFRDGDPDGNGQADTVPWTGTNNQWFCAYGITGAYIPMDGELVIRYRHPNYQAALETLASLYADKLIDQEFIIRQNDNTAMDELLTTHKAGACERTGNEATRLTTMMRETDPDAAFGPIEPIEGPGGRWIQARSPIGSAGAITAQAEEPEKLMMYLNWLWSDEGILLTNFGEEGVHHKIVDGKPVLLPPYDAGYDEARKAGMTANWTPLYWSGDSFLTRAMSGKTEDTLTELERLTYDAYTKNGDYAFYAVPGAVTSTESAKAYEADVLTPLSDMEQQVIMGTAAYEDLLALLSEVDGELTRIMDEINAAYRAAVGG